MILNEATEIVEGETIIKLRKISTKYFGQKWQRRTEDDPEAAVKDEMCQRGVVRGWPGKGCFQF